MSIKKSLPKKVQEKLKGKNYKVVPVNEKEKYSKAKFIYVYKSYDMLENLCSVRAYIQRKHNIEWILLELLLKLMGLKVFDRQTFKEIPKNYKFSRFNTFLTMGYTNLVMDHVREEERLYCLNPKARKIVVEFYTYLSGEEKIPEDKNNPLITSGVQSDRKKMDLIRKLNKLEPKEHISYLFK